MLKPISVLEYFQQVLVNESFVLRFLYRPEKTRFDLVFCYAAPAVSEAFRTWPQLPDPAPPRDLRWIRFTGVSLFSCRRRDLSTDRDGKQYEQAVLASRPTILDLELRKAAGRYEGEIWLDTLGRHALCFEAALAAQRLVYAEKAGNSWKYFDTASRLPVDFFNPFPKLDGE